MRIELKFAGLFGVVAAVVALLAIAVGTSAAGASEFKTSSFPVTFLGEGLGLSTFLSENLNSVTCHNSHSKGSVTSSTDAKVTITYLTGCELVVEKSSIGKFKEACPTITTNELLLVPLSAISGTKLFGLLVLPVTGTELAKFICSGGNKVEVKIKGSLICESTPVGSLVTKGKVICNANAAKHGEQEFTSGTNPEGSVVNSGLTAETTVFGIFKTTEKDTQQTTEDVTYPQAIEQTAEGPWVEVKRVGGEATEGANGQCQFTAVKQKCQIRFKNITMRTLVAKSHFWQGEKAEKPRYNLTAEGCVLNLGLGECTDEIEVAQYEPGARNSYCLIVEDKGNAEKRNFCANLWME